jgi:flagellum-specific ATP synthase
MGWIDAECVGFRDEITYLMAFDPVGGLMPGALVIPATYLSSEGDRYQEFSQGSALPIGQALLGRIVDGLGRALDNQGDPHGAAQQKDLNFRYLRPNPLRRRMIEEPLDTGLRVVNSLLTVGKGQRLGIFAGSGVGKSVLISMLTRHCAADVIVVALVGERSREVREFYENSLTEEARARTVLVTSPADTSPLARARGAEYAAEVAAYFRDAGMNVVMIVDSLTRYAIACREISMSMGEPPVSRGYPPSVFAKLTSLVEKAGNGEKEQGSLTAFYTVLLDSDDAVDPVADAARGVLDGHLFLSRSLANSGHFPAIDVERSISRVMPQVVSSEHLQLSALMRGLISKYMQSRDMVMMGAYTAGLDKQLDFALQTWPRLEQFLQQGPMDYISLHDSISQLKKILSGDGRP